MCLQAALDRFAFMTPTTALGVLVALQPLALLKKHIQVLPWLPLFNPYLTPVLLLSYPCLATCLAPVLPPVLAPVWLLFWPLSGPCLTPCCPCLAAIQCHQTYVGCLTFAIAIRVPHTPLAVYMMFCFS